MGVYTTPACTVCGEKSKVHGISTTDLARWIGGEYIQTVWPDMTPDERELIKTGTHPVCWDSLFEF